MLFNFDRVPYISGHRFVQQDGLFVRPLFCVIDLKHGIYNFDFYESTYINPFSIYLSYFISVIQSNWTYVQDSNPKNLRAHV